jgi:hypothetical protein
MSNNNIFQVLSADIMDKALHETHNKIVTVLVTSRKLKYKKAKKYLYTDSLNDANTLFIYIEHENFEIENKIPENMLPFLAFYHNTERLKVITNFNGTSVITHLNELKQLLSEINKTHQIETQLETQLEKPAEKLIENTLEKVNQSKEVEKEDTTIEKDDKDIEKENKKREETNQRIQELEHLEKLVKLKKLRAIQCMDGDILAEGADKIVSASSGLSSPKNNPKNSSKNENSDSDSF